MCGILGIASPPPRFDSSWLSIASDTLKHRGPDDAGQWWSKDGQVGLAHRRLSIIDLSPLGHQPMHMPELGLTVVYNGEIYNFEELRGVLEQQGFVFRSHSDTEVLLAAYAEWGTDCLARLNGMFAFALYDANKRQLFLARDRAGEKPLFYHYNNGTLRFASELKAILADKDLPRKIDPASLDCYLSMGYVPGDLCILEGFNKLPPAHALTFDINTNSLKKWRYWHLPEFCDEGISEQELLEELESLLENSVKRQMISDVPLGVLLSGGVDSSLITAMAARHSNKIKTFNIRFPGYGKYDETEHARLIAKYFGTEHIELEAKPATAELLPRLAQQFDEPMVDSSMIPTFLVCQLVRQHCTVALGGDGGDELFGGYGHYSRLLWMKHRLGIVPEFIRNLISYGAERILPPGIKGRNWLQGLGGDLCCGVPQIALYLDKSSRKKLLGKCGLRGFPAESIRAGRVPTETSILQRATRMDFENYLAEDVLVKVDRASMLNSLEMRAPMLDYRIIEFAFQKVPAHLKATTTDKKILLKKLTQKLLPPEFDRQRKQGFSIPLASWLKEGAFRELFHDTLLAKDCLFDLPYVNKLLVGQNRGRSNNERLFALVLFELWRKKYNINFDWSKNES